jgi:hypothetical protein
VFQAGASWKDVKVLRWRIEPDGRVVYVDDRGDRDHAALAPPAYDFEWREVNRDHQVSGQPIMATEMAEVSALGAALLGGLAAGVFDDLAHAQASLEPALRVIDPVEAWLDRYDAHYRTVYQPAYAALRAVHHAADALTTAWRSHS